MAPEDALQIFSWSIEKHKVLYSEYYGDEDSKRFNLIKDQNMIYDIEVQKKGYVENMQKTPYHFT